MYVPARRRQRQLRRGGLGQVCPSTEQLQGIVDCSDPCQAAYGACAAAVPGIPALPLDVGTSNPLATPQINTLLPGSVSIGLSQALPWFVGGLALVLIVGVISGN